MKVDTRNKRVTVAEELRRDLLNAYNNNKSILELSNSYGVSRSTISRVLSEAGVKPRRGRPKKAAKPTEQTSGSNSV